MCEHRYWERSLRTLWHDVKHAPRRRVRGPGDTAQAAHRDPKHAGHESTTADTSKHVHNAGAKSLALW